MRLIYNNEQKKSEIDSLTCFCVRVCVCERERERERERSIGKTFLLSLFLEAEAANKEKHPPTTRSSTFKAEDINGVWLR